MYARQDAVGDAVGDGSSLACAGTSQDHNGTVECLRNGPLLGIQPEEGVDVR